MTGSLVLFGCGHLALEECEIGHCTDMYASHFVVKEGKVRFHAEFCVSVLCF